MENYIYFSLASKSLASAWWRLVEQNVFLVIHTLNDFFSSLKLPPVFNGGVDGGSQSDGLCCRSCSAALSLSNFMAVAAGLIIKGCLAARVNILSDFLPHPEELCPQFSAQPVMTNAVASCLLLSHESYLHSSPFKRTSKCQNLCWAHGVGPAKAPQPVVMHERREAISTAYLFWFPTPNRFGAHPHPGKWILNDLIGECPFFSSRSTPELGDVLYNLVSGVSNRVITGKRKCFCT